ncbi:SCO family protein [Calidifontibacillus oryziterrae]|uniref:SCO family protein n=1 Tax=Calidifontibacillus oryziterrae TaxID=1191699 RepID=UPI0002FF54B3|nr:SCO family protein [Calidifontibacillus oryziterrae]
MRRILAIAFLSFLLIALTGCGKQIENTVQYPIENFSFTNQMNETVTMESLKDKVWIADFIFTNCDDVCPPMTANMVKLQRLVKDEGIENVNFVSFSVDPEFDSPEVLFDFAEKFGADQSNWYFLTGYSQERIEEFALNSFKALVQNNPNSDQVAHGTSFYLIDTNGDMIKYYDGMNVPFEEIISDLKIISK